MVAEKKERNGKNYKSDTRLGGDLKSELDGDLKLRMIKILELPTDGVVQSVECLWDNRKA